MENRPQYRSLFWPIVLIGVGVIWLLVNLGYVSTANAFNLWRLWPLLLIAAGLDILAGRRAPIVGALFGLIVIGVVGVFLLGNVQIPGTVSAQVKTERIHLPIDTAKRAHVTLNFWSDSVDLNALSDSKELIDGEITHVGQIHFSGTGSDEKTVTLSHDNEFLGPMFFSNAETHTKIGLTPNLPLDLTIDGASGSQNLDLSRLNLTALSLDSGSGSVELSLPASPGQYEARIHSGSGSINLSVAAGANALLSFDSGSGSVNVRLPGDAAVHIEVNDDGSGSLSLPSGLTQLSKGSGDRGTWETSGYAGAKNKIEIRIDNMGSGSFSISK